MLLVINFTDDHFVAA